MTTAPRKTAAELLAEADRIDAEYSALEAVRAPTREFAELVGDFAQRASRSLSGVKVLTIMVDASFARDLGLYFEGGIIATAVGNVYVEVKP
jgi:hypothetical protein